MSVGFQNQIDICNRSLQMCGVSRMITDFTEDTMQAGECAFVYDKLRRAELQRNVWKFSIKKTALRPIDTTTKLISPSLWSASTTYAYGELVTDASGVIWQSRIQDNFNNNPTNASSVTSYAWEVYCGPDTASLYDSTGTTNYYAGEIVYDTPGDGTYNVYMSLQSGNSQDPRVPSEWSSTVQYSKDQVVGLYAAWAIGTTYAAGAGIAYLGNFYISLAAGNVGNKPSTSPTKWVVLQTALAPPYYNSLTAYVIGQFVTYLGTNYVCIAASTGNLPTNATYWAAQVGESIFVSLIDFNLNNNPSLAPVTWGAGTTYTIGQTVAGSDGYIYSSVGNGNLGNDPTLTSGFWNDTGVLTPWIPSGAFGVAADQWATLSSALTDLNIIYPIGTGPAYQSYTRNVYRVPVGFIRQAPQDSRAGSVSYMGAPSGLQYTDWTFEGKYITSTNTYPIILRYAGDVTDVSLFDDMFCELLAAHISLMIVDRLTQSTAKMQNIAALYKQFGSEARIINGIELGPTEPPEDDWVQARL